MEQEISLPMVVGYLLITMVVRCADILVVVVELPFTVKIQHGQEKQQRTRRVEHLPVLCILTAAIVVKIH